MPIPLIYLTFCFCCVSIFSFAQFTPPSFKVIPLGIKGGLEESNLSSYAVAVTGTEEYVCLDAGTLYSGIQKVVSEGVWQGDATDLLKTKIKGYLISHGHLDHLAGLVINSPDDSAKPIYGTATCLDVLKEKYFSWKNWANFADAGEKPFLNKYNYVTLTPGNEIPLSSTSMNVKAFALSHASPYESTAFLIRNQENYLLYLGDTGADEIEKSTRLHELWKAIAPMIKSKRLKAIFIEVSFANEQPAHLLFGHLTPSLLMKEMNALNELSGNDSLKEVSIVITHMKPAGTREATIKEQLQRANAIGLKLVFPTQARLMEF